MKEIPLTRGKVALVDDEDFEELSKHKWYTSLTRSNMYYARRWICQKGGMKIGIAMHHVLLPPKPGTQTDHANGNGLDNRRSNLRYATKQQQMANRRPFVGRKYKGVYLAKQCREDSSKPRRWESQIRVSKKLIQLGTFGTMEEAALAYNQAAIEHFGEYARLNQVTSPQPAS